MRTRFLALLPVALAALGIAAQPASASVVLGYSGTAVAAWSNPVLAGNLVDGATGAVLPYDNTATAACNIGCPVATAFGTDTVSWGNNTDTSYVTFTGNAFAVPLGVPFDIGTFTFFNGTSGGESIIFGATLTLTFGPGIDNSVVPMQIVTTLNTGTPEQNADFVGFAPSLPVTFNVLEGATASADLYGELVSDPHTKLLTLVLDPGSVGLGFIGFGRPSVPEPASLALLGAGLVGIGLVRRKRVR